MLFYIFASLLVIFCCLNIYYLKVVLRYSQENHILSSKKKKYGIVSFGSAYCRFGIDFGDSNGCNFGYGSQFLYYTDKMLREYSKRCLIKGGIVYLIIANLVFAEVGKGLYCKNQMQRLLSKKSLEEEYSLFRKIRFSYFPLINPFLLVKTLLHLIKFQFITDRDTYSTITTNDLSYSDTLLSANNRCSDWCKQFGFVNTINKPSEDFLKEKFAATRGILTKMIQFCLDNGYKPILVVTPVSCAMNSCMGDDFLDYVLYSNIRKANVQQVPFFDYLRDSRFQDIKLYQNNADFLNARGRLLFTQTLLKESAQI